MSLRRPALPALLSLVVSFVLATAGLVGLSSPAHADDPLASIRINEVESNGDVRDWIELTNIGATSTDVGGFVLMDDTTRTLTIPAGTTIAPGGYLAVDVDDPAVPGNFGLGAADQARVFLPGGTTLVDSYSWTSHAAVTYGRCPNGTGAFANTPTSTKGAANPCAPTGVASVKFNEVESNGDPVGDWAELKNTGAAPVDIGGLKFKDNDDAHAFYTIPAGTVVPAGGYFVLNEADFNFGLGSPDSVRLFQEDGTTLVDSYSWTPHAATTYGRCPDGTGAFATTAAATKGAANNCAPLVAINEVESDGGTPGDWIELFNYGTEPAAIGGLVLKDNDDAHAHSVPAGTMLAAGGYYVAEEAALGFGLGSSDSARLFAADGATLVDSYTWTSHAATTYGRCPNGTGAFATTQVVTKGALNNCPGDIVTEAWPGGTTVATADVDGALGGDISGLTYDGSGTAAPGVLWAVNNGDGTLIRLLWNGSAWASDTANGWSSAGKPLKYADGNGVPDTEGVTVGGATSAAGIYTATERNNQVSGTSRPTILRYDVSGAGTSLTATNEWFIGPDLPGGIAANAGPEAVQWVPDTYLVANGLKDQAAGGAAYDPASYPNHGNGLFFVALEANSRVYAYALNHADSTFTRITSFASGYANGVMALDWEAEANRLWVVCDDTCGGIHGTFQIQAGEFKAVKYFERPAGMPNLNNEGFTTTPRAECVGGVKPVYWSDDAATGGNAIRSGTISCTPRTAQTVAFTSTKPASAVVGQTYAVTATGGASGNPVVLSAAPNPAGACTLASGTVTFRHPGTCVINAAQAGDDDYAPGSATAQSVPISRATTTTGSVTVTPTSIGAAVAPSAPGAGVPTGLVTFSVDGVEIGTGALANGVATIDHVVPTGATRTILASYLGSDDYAESGATQIRRDPTIGIEISATPNAAGWYAGLVTVTFTCTPNGSPLVGSCPAPVALDSSGAGQVVSGIVKAQDGGRAEASSGPIDIDLDAPTVKVGGVKAGKVYKRKPEPACVGGDTTSGVARCTLRIERIAKRTFRVTATAVDAAGNTATAAKVYRLKKRAKR